jgi:hypothetical protein
LVVLSLILANIVPVVLNILGEGASKPSATMDVDGVRLLGSNVLLWSMYGEEKCDGLENWPLASWTMLFEKLLSK